MKAVVFSIAALLSLAFASPQDYGSSPSSTSSTTPTSSSAASTTDSADGEVQTVQVGQGGLVFTPDTITADQGDVIEFHIQDTHSVASSTFANPCQPVSGAGIWSGFSSSANTIFSVTVNSTDPLWIYCAAPQHCQAGMVMAVNPPTSGNTLSAYKAAASKTSNSGTPANIAGGVFGAAKNPEASSSASGSSSGSSSATASAASTSSSSGAGSVSANVFLAGGLLFAGVAYAL